jgi:hypothetical protein
MNDIITKIANSYVTGKMEYDLPELSEVITRTIDYHLERSTNDVDLLVSIYGVQNVVILDKIKFYSKKLFDGIVSNDQQTIQVFWKLFNDMNQSMTKSYMSNVLSSI